MNKQYTQLQATKDEVHFKNTLPVYWKLKIYFSGGPVGWEYSYYSVTKYAVPLIQLLSIYEEKVSFTNLSLEKNCQCFDWMVQSSYFCPDNDWNIQLKRQQVIFWAQVGNR